MPRDLTAVAALNSGRLRAEAAALRAASGDTGDTERFGQAAEISVLGTAVKPHKLELFDRLGEVVCARRISQENPARDPAVPAEDTYANEQGRHYPMRTAFEDHWTGGRDFVYFALLLDGLAPPDYGDYTLVVDPAECTLSALACFPGNTAERYAASGTLDVARCESEAAAWADRGALLVTKHGTDPLPAEVDWPTLVCRAADFSERRDTAARGGTTRRDARCAGSLERLRGRYREDVTVGPILLARTPNGDAAFVRREDGRIWLLSRRVTREANEADIDRAVAAADFVRVDLAFQSWDALQSALTEVAEAWLAERTWPGVETYSVDTVERILAAALRVGGDNYRVAWTLLRDCPAAKDPRVYDRLLDLLQPEVPGAGPTIPAQHHAAYTRVQSEMEAAA